MFLLLEEVATRSGKETLMEVDDNSALIVCDSQWILYQQLRLRSICLINIVINIIITNQIIIDDYIILLN